MTLNPNILVGPIIETAFVINRMGINSKESSTPREFYFFFTVRHNMATSTHFEIVYVTENSAVRITSVY